MTGTPSPVPSNGLRRHYNPLKEDDHLGLLARTLPPADPPTELHLTDKTLDGHVTKYDVTLVVFYMKCEWPSADSILCNG